MASRCVNLALVIHVVMNVLSVCIPLFSVLNVIKFHHGSAKNVIPPRQLFELHLGLLWGLSDLQG